MNLTASSRTALVLAAVATVACATGCSSEDETTTETSVAALEAGCRAYAEAAVDKGAECPLDLLDLASRDELVDRLARTCAGLFGAPGSGATRQNLEACATATRASTCIEFHDHIEACQEMFLGTLPAHEPCMFDSQCDTGVCLTTPGEACGTCAWRGKVGEVCGVGPMDIPCDEGLVCLQTKGTSGTCEPVEAAEVRKPAAETPCIETSDCGSGWLRCVAGACVAIGTRCVSQFDCKASQQCKEGACVDVPLAGAGQSCSFQSDVGYSVECDAALYCDAVSETCRSRVLEGGPCSQKDYPRRCASGLSCIGDRCIVPVVEDYTCGGEDNGSLLP